MHKLIRGMLMLLFTGWVGAAIAIPITSADIMTVDGRQWAQADLFVNLSWDDINSVCPAGLCVDGGMLGLYEMTDWTWASISEMNTLFNRYLSNQGVTGTDLLGPGRDTLYHTGSSTWAAQFFADGWRPTVEVDGVGRGAAGLLRELHNSSEGYVAELTELTDMSYASTNIVSYRDNPLSTMGGWFFRAESPPSAIPEPAAITLFGLCLLSLVWSRRKNA